MTEKLNLPAVPTELVTDESALKHACSQLRASRRFAFDTEFIGENTYQPILCLIQVATADEVWLLDPFALDREKMLPFWKLLADDSLEKICHAGDQDVEIAWQQSGLIARNMFDTQIGAGMLGISYPTALWRVVEHFAGVLLEKAHTYSAWDRRPLSKSQFAYAVDDVRYLPLIHDAMKATLTEQGHLGWMQAACDEMCVDSAQPGDARKMYTRLRGAAGLKSDQLSVLREVTALREQIAYERDLPSRAVMKDEALMDIAGRMPNSVKSLSALRDVPRDLADHHGDLIIEAVHRGLAVPDADRPAITIPGEDSAAVKRLSETLWVAAQVICLGQSVTPGLVTSQNEILALARLVHKKQPIDKHPLMTGWHRECLGEKLAAFLSGRLEVGVKMNGEELRGRFLNDV